MAEFRRLAALARYEVLDTPPEAGFDRITHLAAAVFEAPVCVLSFTDRDRHWFKSHFGVSTGEVSRTMAFADFTINQGQAFVVPDTRADPRFARSPAVTGEPSFQFYAGVPLIVPGNLRIGTLCVLDVRPRTDFDERCRGILAGFAATVVELLEGRAARIRAGRRKARPAKRRSPGARTTAGPDGPIESVGRVRDALEDGEFRLHFQPKINMLTGRIIGAEALLRWHHPDRGLLNPGDFLPIVEDHPVGAELEDWVIDSALAQLSEWRTAGLDMPISVNVGPHQLQRADFVSHLADLLAAHPEVTPSSLSLEILETRALQKLGQVSEIIRHCRGLGVRFALDDFGTGYSSLSYLQQLPMDELKIDRSFVRDLLQDSNSSFIAQTIVSLGRAMGLTVVAEGVETAEQRDYLADLGCHSYQGYFYSPAVPADEFRFLLDAVADPPGHFHGSA